MAVTQQKKQQREVFYDFPLNEDVEIVRKSIEQAKQALLFGEMRCIVGESGVGKSKVIEAIKRRFPNNTYIVNCRKSQRKNRVMMEALRQFGLNDKMTYDDSIDELKYRLKKGMLVLVNEPEHLGIDSIEGFRYLCDETGCAFLFIGLPQFLNYVKSHRRTYEYVYNRINNNYHAKGMSIADYEKLIKSANIDVKYAPLLHDLSSVDTGKERVAVTRFLRSILRTVILQCIEQNLNMEDEKNMIKLFKAASKKLEVNIR